MDTIKMEIAGLSSAGAAEERGDGAHVPVPAARVGSTTAVARATPGDDGEIIDLTRNPFLTPACCGAIPSRGYRLYSL